MLDEALKTEADSLACQEVAVLDLSSHFFRQEGLVARHYQQRKLIFKSQRFLIWHLTISEKKKNARSILRGVIRGQLSLNKACTEFIFLLFSFFFFTILSFH